MSSLQPRHARVIRKSPAEGQLGLTFGETSDLDLESGLPERWLPIPDWAGYEASDMGRIRSWIRCRGLPGRRVMPLILRPQKAGEGYRKVANYLNGIHAQDYIHRLVLFAFVGPCPLDHECRHKDGDRTNNRLSNLKWATPEENAKDKVTHGTLVPYVEPPPNEPFYFFDPFIPVEAIIPVEVWKEIRDCPGYEVSSWGQVRSFWCGGCKPRIGTLSGIMGERLGSYGHIQVALRNKDRKPIYPSVHRLMIEAFSPQPDDSLECRHLNGRSSDNHIANLRWSNHTENMRDKVLHGTHNRGIRCGTSKLVESQVREIRRRAANGERSFRLAAEFKVSPATIYMIRKYRIWRHLV